MNKGRTVFALDSTSIDLCLSLFPWAKFCQHKAAIKLHTLLTLQGNFPTVIIDTPGNVHDVDVLDQLTWEAGSFYIMDRGDLDFARLHRLDLCSAFYGTSPNAVRTQVWTAIAVYLLVTILKKRLHLKSSLYTILQILSLTLFETPHSTASFSTRPDSQTSTHSKLPAFIGALNRTVVVSQ